MKTNFHFALALAFVVALVGLMARGESSTVQVGPEPTIRIEIKNR